MSDKNTVKKAYSTLRDTPSGDKIKCKCKLIDKVKKALKSKRGESQSVGSIFNIIIFAIFIVLIIGIMAFYTQYIHLNNCAQNVMSCASTFASASDVKEKATIIAENCGYGNADFQTASSLETAKKTAKESNANITIVLVSPKFFTCNGDKVVQYGDEIDVVICKKIKLSGGYYNRTFNVTSVKTGISKRYFKDVS